LEGDFRTKWQYIKQNKSYMIIALIPIIHAIGFYNTENVDYGLIDLKIKLPLLLPIFIGSSPKLLKSFKIDNLLFVFSISAIISGIYGFVGFELSSPLNSIEDLYQISIMGQNIQVSLLAVTAFCIISNKLFLNPKPVSQLYKIIYTISILWLAAYVYILNSYTGYFVLVIVIVYSALTIARQQNRIIFILSIAFLIFTGLGFTLYIHHLINRFNTTDKIEFSKLPAKTANGNIYQHDTLSKRTEIGHFIDLFICREELRKGWKSRTGTELNIKDRKGQILEETLIRYLTSKGLKKDSSGIAVLTNKDIEFVKSGCANYLYAKKYSFESRIYHVYWQLKIYRETGNPTAQSFSQRVEFLKAAKILARQHFWTGVGSGDVMDSFKNTLKSMDSKLDQRYYNRVHNQYIVELIALGFFGFIAFMVILIYPAIKFKIWKNYLITIFYLVTIVSFFTDNPLETQLGVSYFAVFYSILMFEFLSMDIVKIST